MEGLRIEVVLCCTDCKDFFEILEDLKEIFNLKPNERLLYSLKILFYETEFTHL